MMQIAFDKKDPNTATKKKMGMAALKDMVIGFSEKGVLGEIAYMKIKFTAAKILGAVWSEERYAKWFYHLYTGKQLDLANPQRFDEKVWWLKLNNRDPLLTRCSDKNRVRGYVQEQGCEGILIPQLDVFDTVAQLDFSRYDCEVVAKCNHGSGGFVFYDPSNPPSDIELKANLKKLDFMLHQNSSVLSREWNYQNIQPKIVVDKVVRDRGGNLPLDYKFMCFDGVPKLLFLDLGLINKDMTYNHGYPRNIYDMDFSLLPVWETRRNAEYPVSKPENWDLMVEIAAALSRPFPFCRVDLYNVDGMIYFGEITFYHGGGCNDIKPEEWDYKIGSWIDLNSPKIVPRVKA